MCILAYEILSIFSYFLFLAYLCDIYISYQNFLNDCSREKFAPLCSAKTSTSDTHAPIILLFIANDKSELYSSRRYGTKCGGCLQGINPQDLVRKARDKVFHLNCFTCLVCRKQMSTGEELYVLDDNKFVCKQDYLSGKPLPDTHHVHGHHGESPKPPSFDTFSDYLA